MPKHIELEPVGTIIREELFEPYGLSVDDVAKAAGIQSWDLEAIIYGNKEITAEIDLRLTKYFGMSEGFFSRLQTDYNMRVAKKKLHGKLKNVISLVDQTKKVAVL
ncbi:MAG: HigA family addiction module antitoxin [Chitinispirillia bacterium]|nr:HigA family addiction module antitoxin [Chitinispirillia bacterium]